MILNGADGERRDLWTAAMRLYRGDAGHCPDEGKDCN
jgi:hypothetical protein